MRLFIITVSLFVALIAWSRVVVARENWTKVGVTIVFGLDHLLIDILLSHHRGLSIHALVSCRMPMAFTLRRLSKLHFILLLPLIFVFEPDGDFPDVASRVAASLLPALILVLNHVLADLVGARDAVAPHETAANYGQDHGQSGCHCEQND